MASVRVTINGREYVITDPEVADHITYFAQHQNKLGIRELPVYDLLIERKPGGTAYKLLNGSLPYVKRSATSP